MRTGCAFFGFIRTSAPELDGYTLNLLVDTGADISFLAADALEYAGKAEKIAKAVATFEWGKSNCDVYSISQLTWDREQFAQVRVAVVDRSQHRFLELSGLDGILGYSFFKGKSLTMDYLRMEVELRASDTGSEPASDSTPFTMLDQLVIVVAEVAGKPARLIVDTGTDLLLLDREYCVEAGILDGPAARHADPQDVRIPNSASEHSMTPACRPTRRKFLR
jgi:hypothetical protein